MTDFSICVMSQPPTKPGCYWGQNVEIEFGISKARFELEFLQLTEDGWLWNGDPVTIGTGEFVPVPTPDELRGMRTRLEALERRRPFIHLDGDATIECAEIEQITVGQGGKLVVKDSVVAGLSMEWMDSDIVKENASGNDG